MQRIVCGRPAYLAQHNEPRVPDDLASHDWIGITSVFHPERLALENDREERMTVALHTTFRVNSGYAARSLMLSGVGIGMLPDYAVQRALAEPTLVRLC